jgi:hypothetical protein
MHFLSHYFHILQMLCMDGNYFSLLIGPANRATPTFFLPAPLPRLPPPHRCPAFASPPPPASTSSPPSPANRPLQPCPPHRAAGPPPTSSMAGGEKSPKP